MAHGTFLTRLLRLHKPPEGHLVHCASNHSSLLLCLASSSLPLETHLQLSSWIRASLFGKAEPVALSSEPFSGISPNSYYHGYLLHYNLSPLKVVNAFRVPIYDHL